MIIQLGYTWIYLDTPRFRDQLDTPGSSNSPHFGFLENLTYVLQRDCLDEVCLCLKVEDLKITTGLRLGPNSSVHEDVGLVI